MAGVVAPTFSAPCCAALAERAVMTGAPHGGCVCHIEQMRLRTSVELLMPTKQPRGEERTRELHVANQGLHHRRLRIEHVNSSVKRCRIVQDRIRLWKEDIRDLMRELCCALHNFRVRLTAWQPMI